MFFQFLFSTFWSYESTSLIWMLFAVLTKILASIFDKESVFKCVQVTSFDHFHTFYDAFTYCDHLLTTTATRWHYQGCVTTRLPEVSPLYLPSSMAVPPCSKQRWLGNDRCRLIQGLISILLALCTVIISQDIIIFILLLFSIHAVFFIRDTVNL